LKRLAILGKFQQANDGGKLFFTCLVHCRWVDCGDYREIGDARAHDDFWTIVLGIIGSIIGGAVTHMFSHPTTGRFHPAGLIFSTLGAIWFSTFASS
jgi:Transglycosylase associated protein